MPNNIQEVNKQDYKQLKKIGMACFDTTVDPHREHFIARLLFLRYFSKRKFKERYNQGTHIYGLYEDDLCVGFYELEMNGNLASLYVLPTKQKKGYGKALLKHALNKARVLKMEEMELDSSEYAIPFYKRLGFKEVQKKREIIGVSMVKMKIKILKTENF